MLVVGEPRGGTPLDAPRVRMRRALQQIGAISILIALQACTVRNNGQHVFVGGQELHLQELNPTEVASEVQVIRRDERVLYRAPTIHVTEVVNLRRGGPTLGAQMGRVQLGRSGALQGVRDLRSGGLSHYVLYSSEVVEGKGRYLAVRQADGQALHFTTATRQDPCVPECFAVIETLVVDLPDGTLRAAPDSGLALSVTLDNGFTFPVTVPVAYLRGYLQAVDANPR